MEKTPDKNNLLQSHSHVIPIVPCSHVLLLLWPTCKHSDQIRSAMLSVQSVTQNSYAGDGDSTPKSQTEIALRNSLEASGKALTLAKTCRFVSASVHVQPDEDFSKLYHILVGSCAGLASPYKRCQGLTHLKFCFALSCYHAGTGHHKCLSLYESEVQSMENIGQQCFLE